MPGENQIPGWASARACARWEESMSVPMVTIRSTPASRARCSTAGRSAANASLSRWAWESTSMTDYGTKESGGTLFVATGQRVGGGADVDGVLAGPGDELLAADELLDQLLGGLLVAEIVALRALLIADREDPGEAGLVRIQRQAAELVRVIVLGTAGLEVVDAEFLQLLHVAGHLRIGDVAHVDLAGRRLGERLSGAVCHPVAPGFGHDGAERRLGPLGLLLGKRTEVGDLEDGQAVGGVGERLRGSPVAAAGMQRDQEGQHRDLRDDTPPAHASPLLRPVLTGRSSGPCSCASGYRRFSPRGSACRP